jgi:hypothetical protein
MLKGPKLNADAFPISRTVTAIKFIAATALVSMASLGAATAQDTAGGDAAALAKKLSNPIASLISVPIQFNYDSGYGPEDGDKAFVNVQPVIPFDLTDSLSLVTRTILPVVWQDDIAGPSGDQFGLGDTLQSFFLVPSPRETGLGTLTFGAGPAITWPTSTDPLLGSGTVGLGPTGVFLFQNGPWTVGGLAGHQWGVVETRDNVPDLNSTFFQPFVAYNTPSAWTFGANIEGSYNWTSDEVSLPVNITVSKLTSIGKQRVQFQLGARYWLESPTNGPEDFGVRAAIVFLFPK